MQIVQSRCSITYLFRVVVGMEYVHIESLECGPGGNSSNFKTAYEGCSCMGPCTASTGCTCLLYKQASLNHFDIMSYQALLAIIETLKIIGI